jgi:hypothetical protein
MTDPHELDEAALEVACETMYAVFGPVELDEVREVIRAYLAAARREPAVGALRDTATSIQACVDTATSIQACVEGAVYRDDATVDVDVSVLINWRDNILDYLAAARREPAVDTSRADSWPHHNQMDATGAEKLKRVAGMMDLNTSVVSAGSATNFPTNAPLAQQCLSGGKKNVPSAAPRGKGEETCHLTGPIL